MAWHAKAVLLLQPAARRCGGCVALSRRRSRNDPARATRSAGPAQLRATVTAVTLTLSPVARFGPGPSESRAHEPPPWRPPGPGVSDAQGLAARPLAQAADACGS
jgi:hypothetical protein